MNAFVTSATSFTLGVILSFCVCAAQVWGSETPPHSPCESEMAPLPDSPPLTLEHLRVALVAWAKRKGLTWEPTDETIRALRVHLPRYLDALGKSGFSTTDLELGRVYLEGRNLDGLFFHDAARAPDPSKIFPHLDDIKAAFRAGLSDIYIPDPLVEPTLKKLIGLFLKESAFMAHGPTQKALSSLRLIRFTIGTHVYVAPILDWLEPDHPGIGFSTLGLLFVFINKWETNARALTVSLPDSPLSRGVDGRAIFGTLSELNEFEHVERLTKRLVLRNGDESIPSTDEVAQAAMMTANWLNHLNSLFLGKLLKQDAVDFPYAVDITAELKAYETQQEQANLAAREAQHKLARHAKILAQQEKQKAEAMKKAAQEAKRRDEAISKALENIRKHASAIGFLLGDQFDAQIQLLREISPTPNSRDLDAVVRELIPFAKSFGGWSPAAQSVDLVLGDLKQLLQLTLPAGAYDKMKEAWHALAQTAKQHNAETREAYRRAHHEATLRAMAQARDPKIHYAAWRENRLATLHGLPKRDQLWARVEMLFEERAITEAFRNRLRASLAGNRYLAGFETEIDFIERMHFKHGLKVTSPEAEQGLPVDFFVHMRGVSRSIGPSGRTRQKPPAADGLFVEAKDVAVMSSTGAILESLENSLARASDQLRHVQTPGASLPRVVWVNFSFADDSTPDHIRASEANTLLTWADAALRSIDPQNNIDAVVFTRTYRFEHNILGIRTPQGGQWMDSVTGPAKVFLDIILSTP